MAHPEQRGNEAEDLIRHPFADGSSSGTAAQDDLPGRYLAVRQEVLVRQRPVVQADAEALAPGSTERVPADDDDRRGAERLESSSASSRRA